MLKILGKTSFLEKHRKMITEKEQLRIPFFGCMTLSLTQNSLSADCRLSADETDHT
jgi:hypothetical protein